MPAVLIVSAFLLSGFGCIMPIAWVAEVRVLRRGVFVVWVLLIAVSVLMGSLYPTQLMGANPLLKVGLESICLVCAIYPAHGFISSLLSDGAGRDGTVALLAFADYAVTAVGYICLLFGTIWLIFF